MYFLTKKKGFTLVELLIVISIIAILVLIVIIAINPLTVIQQSNDSKRRTEANQIKTALQLYFNENGEYPPDLPTLVSDHIRALPENFEAGGDWDYAPSGDGSNYDAWILLEQPTGDDADTVTRCSNDSDETGSVPAGAFMICPD